MNVLLYRHSWLSHWPLRLDQSPAYPLALRLGDAESPKPLTIRLVHLTPCPHLKAIGVPLRVTLLASIQVSLKGHIWVTPLTPIIQEILGFLGVLVPEIRAKYTFLYHKIIKSHLPSLYKLTSQSTIYAKVQGTQTCQINQKAKSCRTQTSQFQLHKYNNRDCMILA